MCAAAHCPWDDDYDVLPAIQHLLAARAPRPHAHQQTLDLQEPYQPVQPNPLSPAATADRNAEHQRKEPDRTATPPPLPPPKGKVYATLASTLPHHMDTEQYYQCVLRELPANHATLKGWRQAKGDDNEWGPEDDLLWEDTWEGTMDTFLEGEATTYPHPPGDTRHGLHSLLAFHSWKHHHTITLKPLDHNPHRWTPEDDATTAITIQQDPSNPAGYPLT